jgi:hypothetical protein
MRFFRVAGFSLLCPVILLWGQIPKSSDLIFHVVVPEEIAAGEYRGAPVLALEGVELGKGEGLTIEVLGETGGASAEKILFGTASIVGHRQASPAKPVWKANLRVPFTERAARTLVDRHEIELTLRVRNNPDRAPLKLDRVYFQPGGR